MTQYTFDRPCRVTVSVRGNATPGTIHLVGINNMGDAVSEDPPSIPVLSPNQTWEFTALHTYRELYVTRAGLNSAEIAVEGIESAKYVFTPHLPRFSKQDKAELKALVREVIREELQRSNL